jgi:hypothetical protein
MIVELLATTCLMGSGDFTAPRTSDNCTPGSYTEQLACEPRKRPSLPAADRREILRRYGLTTWSGADGEFDHRVPFFLGGNTDRTNIWPERGPVGDNPKDKLENYLYRRICVKHSMTIRNGRRIFLTDWRPWYKRYKRYL